MLNEKTRKRPNLGALKGFMIYQKILNKSGMILEELCMKETDVAKSYLRQILKIDKLINRLIDTVSTLRKSLTSISCEIKERVQTSGPKDTAAGTIAKIVDMENEINQQEDET